MLRHDDTFAARFEVLSSVAYRVAYRILGSRADAEEVTQEALARALARWRSVEPHAVPWVVRVATNLAIGRWRKQRPSVPIELRHGGTTEGADALALERMGLVEAIARLPRRQREVIALRYLADLSEQDAAAAMHTTVGSVKQHAHRALARLRLDVPPLLAITEADDA